MVKNRKHFQSHSGKSSSDHNENTKLNFEDSEKENEAFDEGSEVKFNLAKNTYLSKGNEEVKVG